VTVPTTLWIITDKLPGPESCQFIEMEDDNGSSHGKDVGIEWKKYPTPSEELAALGPFFSKKEVIPLIQKAHDKMDQENANRLGYNPTCYWCNRSGYDATGILHTDDCILVEMRKVLGN
jgi:hypothetical protein